MKTVELTKAKTDWNELLNRVFAGETIRITRGGVPIAKLAPLEEVEKKDLKEIVKEIREISKGASLGGLTTRQLINAGRRY